MSLLPTTFFTGSSEPSGQPATYLPPRHLEPLKSAVSWPPILPVPTGHQSALYNHPSTTNCLTSPTLVTESLSTYNSFPPSFINIPPPCLHPSYHSLIQIPSLINFVLYGIFSSSVFPSRNFSWTSQSQVGDSVYVLIMTPSAWSPSS